MPHWIEQKTAQSKARTEATQTRRAQGLQTFNQLEAIIRRDVAKWNEMNPGYRRKIECGVRSVPNQGFEIQKTSFPPVSVYAAIAADSLSIHVESTKLSPGGKQAYTAHDRFDLEPAANGDLCRTIHAGASISLEETSRLLLEPIIESMSDL